MQQYKQQKQSVKRYHEMATHSPSILEVKAMLEYNEIKKRITALLYLDFDKGERFF